MRCEFGTILTWPVRSDKAENPTEIWNPDTDYNWSMPAFKYPYIVVWWLRNTVLQHCTGFRWQLLGSCHRLECKNTFFTVLVRFKVLTAANKKMAVFWVVAPCGLGEVYRRFRGACCLHIWTHFIPDYMAQQSERQPYCNILVLRIYY
jgi:hypothetical protein